MQILTANIDISDKLISGQIGTVKHITAKEKEVSTIYLTLADTFAEEIYGNDTIAKSIRLAPIEREGEEVLVCLRKDKNLTYNSKNTICANAIVGLYSPQTPGFEFKCSNN